MWINITPIERGSSLVFNTEPAPLLFILESAKGGKENWLS
jgi:hypothetical protein